MKKYLSIIAAAAVILSLTGCAGKTYDLPDSNATESPSAVDSVPLENAEGEGYESTDLTGITPGRSKVGDTVSEGLDIAAESVNDADDFSEPQAGMLTGGEWNDNAHWEDWQDLYSSHSEWNSLKEIWENRTAHRVAVTVTSDGKTPVEGAKLWGKGCLNSAVTDNKGRAYLFFDDTAPFELSCECKDKSCSLNVDWVDPSVDQTISITLDGSESSVGGKLDLMIMCDTTGSMNDELDYLKKELENIVRKIKSDNENIPTNISVNFYRDEGDEYVVRQFPFTDDIEEAAAAIREQSADGGGDFAEAVHAALESALDNHEWREDAVKIMFLVLDAPPHEDAQIIDSVNDSIKKAAEMGVRIIPLASSGIDTSTEYLLRTIAFQTGGTYTFLTDDSGIGNSHLAPTVGAFNVEKLSDMLIRIVNSYLE